MSSKKIIIVGAGIVGFSTAYYLVQAGHDVTIIDQTDGQNNCSFGNAGYVSPSHMVPLASPGIINQGLKWMLNSKSPFYIKPKLDLDLIKWGMLFKKASTSRRVEQAIPVLHQLTVKSQILYEEILEQERIDAGYRKEGLLMVCQTKDALKHEIEVVKIAQALGLNADVISKAEIEKLDPNVQYDMAGAVYFGCDGWMTPDVFMNQFRSLLIKKGVKLLFNTKVQDIQIERDCVIGIKTENEIHSADEYVITAGTWSARLMKKLGVFMPLQGGKGYSLTLTKPPEMPKLPAILVEGRIATTPMIHGLRIAGTMELNGTNHNISGKRIDGIVESVKRAMPNFRDYDFSDLQPWAGLRPCSPDGLPYIGRTRKLKNLLVGSGHAMLGWTLGPITGKLLSEEIMGEKHSVNSPLLDVDRYDGHHRIKQTFPIT